MKGWMGFRREGHGGENERREKDTTSAGKELLDAEVRIAYAHEDDVVGFVHFEVVVPKVADKFLHGFLKVSFVGSLSDFLSVVLCREAS